MRSPLISEKLNSIRSGYDKRARAAWSHPESKDNQSLPLSEILLNHIQPLGIPAWYGSMIGHIKDKFTLPVGVLVEIEANTGTIQMLEPAVS